MADSLLELPPERNIDRPMAESQFERFQQRWPKILPELESYADATAQKLLETHLQVRDITQIKKKPTSFKILSSTKFSILDICVERAKHLFV